MGGWGAWVRGLYLQEDPEHGQTPRVLLRRSGVGETLGIKVYNVHLGQRGDP